VFCCFLIAKECSIYRRFTPRRRPSWYLFGSRRQFFPWEPLSICCWRNSAREGTSHEWRGAVPGGNKSKSENEHEPKHELSSISTTCHRMSSSTWWIAYATKHPLSTHTNKARPSTRSNEMVWFGRLGRKAIRTTSRSRFATSPGRPCWRARANSSRNMTQPSADFEPVVRELDGALRAVMLTEIVDSTGMTTRFAYAGWGFLPDDLTVGVICTPITQSANWLTVKKPD
jgi:hypothetical protein